MNGQIYTTINQLEKDIKSLKKLVKKAEKKKAKKGLLIGLWKGLKITDEEVEQAKKDVFDFDVEKYI